MTINEQTAERGEFIESDDLHRAYNRDEGIKLGSGKTAFKLTSAEVDEIRYNVPFRCPRFTIEIWPDGRYTLHDKHNGPQKSGWYRERQARSHSC